MPSSQQKFFGGMFLSLSAAVLFVGLAAAIDGNQMKPSSARVLARSAAVALGSQSVSVDLPVTAATRDRLRHRAAGTQVQLVIFKFAARQQPGASFRIYLGLSDGAAPDQEHFVDTINFFNAVGLDAQPPPHPPSVNFDVSALVTRLVATSNPRAFRVTVVPDGPVAPGSDPRISALMLVES